MIILGQITQSFGYEDMYYFAHEILCKKRITSVYEQVRHYLCVLCTIQKTRQYLSDMAL